MFSVSLLYGMLIILCAKICNCYIYKHAILWIEERSTCVSNCMIFLSLFGKSMHIIE